ncbi:MAG: NADH-quinone oxidoreductase subunit NuoK [Pseudomonadota bacterium]
MSTPLFLHGLSAFLFCMGLFVMMNRRNTILLLMGIELMLNGVNLSFVTFSRELGQLDGQLQLFFIITIAAAESAVGLSILVNVFRNFGSASTDRFKNLKG